MSKTYSLPELRAILAPILQRYQAQGAYLFGSYARGEASQDSDLDVIIFGGPNFDRTDIFAIAEDLFIALGKRVDVFEESEIDFASPFGQAILHDRIVLL